MLVGGLEHQFYFPIQLGMIIPIDELTFFRGVAQPPTRDVSVSVGVHRIEVNGMDVPKNVVHYGCQKTHGGQHLGDPQSAA